MPKGPKGEKRPADTVANAVHVMKIATGEIEETPKQPGPQAAQLGKLGGHARAKKLTVKRRKEIAKAAAKARWKASSDA